MGAVLDNLRECSWRGIAFPVSTLKLSLHQDLAEHKYWGQDGARIESTGRAPLVISVVIPFRNGISKGRSETWGTDGPGGSGLYPDAYRFFMSACQDKSIGVFVHPEFGEIRCKFKSAESTLDPNRRDGQDVHAEFVETIESTTYDTVPFTQPSPVAGAQQAGFDLDLAIGKIKPPGYPTALPAAYVPNFADRIRSLTSIGDRVSLLKKQVGGKYAELKYRADQIESAVLGLTNSSPGLASAAIAATNGNRALLWPIINSCERIKHVANTGQRAQTQKQRVTSFYIVPQRTTLAALTLDIPEATLSDLITLNPQLTAMPAVEAQTVVRYYTPRTR